MLTLIEGKLQRDYDAFSPVDTYAVVQYQGQRYQTHVLKEAGKAPKWNQTFEIPIYNP